MTMTLPYQRQQVTPRSGGRIAGDRRAAGDQGSSAYGSDIPVTVGNTALAPKPGRRTGGKTAPRLRVAPPAPVSVPRAPFVAMVLVVVIAGVIGILVLNTKINENAFRLEALQKQQGNLDRTEAQLTKDLADKESPNSLAAAAKRLGMVPADRPAFITLPDGKILGVPKPASGKPSASDTQQNKQQNSKQKNNGAAANGQPRR
jgi:hypothetical protein